LIEKTKITPNDLNLALSYGSRRYKCCKNICNKVKNNTISIDSIDDSIINEHLYTQNLQRDLLIEQVENIG
jgi:undecaprenyl diphosphate synthase